MRCIALSSIAALALAGLIGTAVDAQAQGLRNNTGSSGVGARATYNEPPPVRASGRQSNLGGGSL
jgi:hypothetical protein